MSATPVIKLINPTDVFKSPLVLISPISQSAAHISTIPTQTKIPALRESSVPNAIKVCLSFSLKFCKTPMPIAIPMGVMSAKASASKYRVGNEVQLGGSNAIRVPRARPSNIWWKMMTIKSEVNAAFPVTTTVTPITTLS